MEVCSSALRGMIIAPAGRKLVVADWSNIEGRILPWLAGEEWKLEAFRKYDKGVGEDLYKVAYGKMFSIDPTTVDKHQRQIGKVNELSMGYQGGVGAFVRFALTSNIDLEALAEQAYPLLPKHIVDQSTEFMHWMLEQKRSNYGLSSKAYIVCDSFKRLWRNGHSKIEAYWDELDRCTKEALINPGITYKCFRHKIRCDGAWLRISKPRGTYLCYPMAKIVGEQVTYMQRGIRVKTYGGKLAENLTQSIAGDILKECMPRLERHGFQTVLTIHDEILAETPDDPKFNAEKMERIFAKPPQWATDLPLAAKGFECYRYRKGD